ncbi:MAG TPA: hypothetical protein VEL28_18875 [Candidatus Binatia bacterium]|nr:hypothetical protein [Candidatus Binatia bacterium]
MWRTGAALFGVAALAGYLVAARGTNGRSESVAAPPQVTRSREVRPFAAIEAKAAPRRGSAAALPTQRLPQPRRTAAEHAQPQPDARQDERIHRKARRLAAREKLSREQIRGLLLDIMEEQTAASSFDDGELERITDAVLRVRAAQRVLRRLRPNGAGQQIRSRHSRERVEAMTEIFSSTGMSTSDLGKVTDAGSDR